MAIALCATRARAEHCEDSNVRLGVTILIIGAFDLGFSIGDAVVDAPGRKARIAEGIAGGAGLLLSGLAAAGVLTADDCERTEPPAAAFLPVALASAGLLAHGLRAPPAEPERPWRVQATAGLLSHVERDTCYQGPCFELGSGWYGAAGVDVALFRRLTVGALLGGGALQASIDQAPEEALSFFEAALTLKAGVPLARRVLMRTVIDGGVRRLEGFGGVRGSLGAGLEAAVDLGERLRLVAEIGVSMPQPVWHVGLGASF